jgi:2-polyprenyl-3-methyl-5-hydroxy-6-metoxy-1,4-benzoquinol methylase
LKFFNPAVAGNENFYNQLQKMDWYFAHPDKTEFQYSATFVKKNNKVLDVGSGRGIWSEYLKNIEGVFYQGIEFSSKSIELAQKDGINVIKESVEDHAKRLPGHYDVVVAFQVLEHIDDIHGFMSACIACIKPGGKLIIAVPNNDGFIRNMVNNWLNVPPHHINHWNEASLIKLGEKLNLQIEEIHKEPVTNVHKLLFYNIYVYTGLRKLIGYRKKIVDNSFGFKLINKFSYWISNIIIRFSAAHKRDDGHTIITVFKKNG